VKHDFRPQGVYTLPYCVWVQQVAAPQRNLREYLLNPPQITCWPREYMNVGIWIANEPPYQVRTDESRPAGYQNASHGLCHNLRVRKGKYESAPTCSKFALLPHDLFGEVPRQE
jgi:hypothetical protein